MRFMVKTAISAWREHFGLSKAELIRRCGLAKTTVYSAEDDGLASPATLIAMANAFGISVSELLSGPPGYNGKSKRPTVRTIPLYTGVPVTGWQTIGVQRTIDVLETRITDPAMVAVVVEGNRMFPTIVPDDVVLVDPTRITPVDGEIVCAIDKRREKGCILRCRRMAGRAVLVGDNPMYPRIAIDESEDIEIIGTVVRIVDRDLRHEHFWPLPDDVQEQYRES